MSSLEKGLSAPKLAELKKRLEGLSSAPDDPIVSVADLQAAVLATLPRIIAVNWEPEAGKNQLEATVSNVLTRLKAVSGPQVKLKMKSTAKVLPMTKVASDARLAARTSNGVAPKPSAAAQPSLPAARVAGDGFTNRIAAGGPEQPAPDRVATPVEKARAEASDAEATQLQISSGGSGTDGTPLATA